jgi:predicted MPP superfamily phosphohydrolase
VISTIALLILIYGFCIEPSQIEIKHLWIRDTELNKVLRGKTAVQISDLHIRTIGKHEEKALKLIEALKPDLIFLNGDYVKWEGDYVPALTFLSRLKAKIGMWAVMGDYDYQTSRKCCLFCHQPGKGLPTQRHNVRFLRNSIDQVSLPDGPLLIGGIEMCF